MPKQLLIVVATLVSLQLQGCGVLRDRRDAPWDPPSGRTLFEQIPAWDGAATKICGGHLDPETRRREGRSDRC